MAATVRFNLHREPSPTASTQNLHWQPTPRVFTENLHRKPPPKTFTETRTITAISCRHREHLGGTESLHRQRFWTCSETSSSGQAGAAELIPEANYSGHSAAEWAVPCMQASTRRQALGARLYATAGRPTEATAATAATLCGRSAKC